MYSLLHTRQQLNAFIGLESESTNMTGSQVLLQRTTPSVYRYKQWDDRDDRSANKNNSTWTKMVGKRTTGAYETKCSQTVAGYVMNNLKREKNLTIVE